MNNKRNIGINLEKFASFLDGNLPEEEMNSIGNTIADIPFLSTMVNESMEIEDSERLNHENDNSSEEYSIDERSFILPDIDEELFKDKKNVVLSDIWGEEMSSINYENPISENHKNNYHMGVNTVNYGYKSNKVNFRVNFDELISQGNKPICAIKAQEIIMRDYGIVIPEEELVKYATDHEWFIPEGEGKGTPMYHMASLLNEVGISTEMKMDANIYDIISELRAGHRVIVSVDAYELWERNPKNPLTRGIWKLVNAMRDKVDSMKGELGANHALIVAGVNVNPDDPSDIKVILTDSGTGQVCVEYPYDQFKDAWDDSHGFMIATKEPAPYQYNYETHQMEPSGFSTDFYPSLVSLPSGLHNLFELPSNYFEMYGEKNPEYNGWNRIIPFWENWDSEKISDENDWELQYANSLSTENNLDDDSTSKGEDDETSPEYENDTEESTSYDDSEIDTFSGEDVGQDSSGYTEENSFSEDGDDYN